MAPSWWQSAHCLEVNVLFDLGTVNLQAESPQPKNVWVERAASVTGTWPLILAVTSLCVYIYIYIYTYIYIYIHTYIHTYMHIYIYTHIYIYIYICCGDPNSTNAKSRRHQTCDFGEHATSVPAELGGEIRNVARDRARTQVLLQARKCHNVIML